MGISAKDGDAEVKGWDNFPGSKATIEQLELLVYKISDAVNSSLASSPKEVRKAPYWRILHMAKQLVELEALNTAAQLDMMLKEVKLLAVDQNWPISRRVVTAALVLRRLKHGPLPGDAVRTASELLLAFFGLHRQAAKHKRFVEFLHVSKSGGAAFCQLAEHNGCTSKSFAPTGGNCLVSAFGDRPRWIDSNTHDALRPKGGSAAAGGAGGASALSPCVEPFFRMRQRDVDHHLGCRRRRNYMKRQGWTVYANEFTALDGERDERNAHMCHDHMLTVVQLRHPIMRLLTHLEYVYHAYHKFCGAEGPQFFDGGKERKGSFWTSLMPAASTNFYIRSLLGERVYMLPPSGITQAHMELARVMLVQFGVLLMADDTPLENHALRYGLGWRVFGRPNPTNTAAHDAAFQLSDAGDLIQLNAPDLELFKFGAVVSRLDALMYDAAHAAGVDVGGRLKRGSGNENDDYDEQDYEDYDDSPEGAGDDGAGGGQAAAKSADGDYDYDDYDQDYSADYDGEPQDADYEEIRQRKGQRGRNSRGNRKRRKARALERRLVSRRLLQAAGTAAGGGGATAAGGGLTSGGGAGGTGLPSASDVACGYVSQAFK